MLKEEGPERSHKLGLNITGERPAFEVFTLFREIEDRPQPCSVITRGLPAARPAFFGKEFGHKIAESQPNDFAGGNEVLRQDKTIAWSESVEIAEAWRGPTRR